jgi:SAM-dependent methyltransferase
MDSSHTPQKIPLENTIHDFGDQWTHYRDNEGYYGSTELLQDILGPLMDIHQIAGTAVADIGSGTGRIVRMLLDAGARHVVSLEPSKAFEVLKWNLRDFTSRITLIQGSGEAIPPSGNLDYVFSIGVLHHIRHPAPVVSAAWKALRPGGRIVLWLYGRENNTAYLLVACPLRFVTKHLPHRLLAWISRQLTYGLDGYMWLGRFIPLPLLGYLTNVFSKLSRPKRELCIYDQLNPAYAKYYTRSEVKDLLEKSGFCDVRLYHRHGYSWTATGEKQQRESPTPCVE